MSHTETSTYSPQNRKEWRNWLENNHISCQSVWVIFYKVKSDNHNLTWSEAVDEALCFGWIDSTKRPIDSERYKQYFSKRKPNSGWSKINKDKVEALTSKGLMAEAGLKTIAEAKENGSWSMMDEIEQLIIPDDLKRALDQDGDARSFFMNLSKSKKKMLLHWVVVAKRKETRIKRIKEVVKHAAKEQMPKQFR
ncbi:YdeI/OmpD-associated family protein [Halocola ammonii]